MESSDQNLMRTIRLCLSSRQWHGVVYVLKWATDVSAGVFLVGRKHESIAERLWTARIAIVRTARRSRVHAVRTEWLDWFRATETVLGDVLRTVLTTGTFVDGSARVRLAVDSTQDQILDAEAEFQNGRLLWWFGSRANGLRSARAVVQFHVSAIAIADSTLVAERVKRALSGELMIASFAQFQSLNASIVAHLHLVQFARDATELVLANALDHVTTRAAARASIADSGVTLALIVVLAVIAVISFWEALSVHQDLLIRTCEWTTQRLLETTAVLEEDARMSLEGAEWRFRFVGVDGIQIGN